MGRRRTTNKHLPKYVTENHGSYYYKGPGMAKPERVCRVGEEQKLYRYLADKLEPQGPAETMDDYFTRYETEILPELAPRTQKDYRRHLGKLRAVFGHMKPSEITVRMCGELLNVKKGRIHRVRMLAVLSTVFTHMVGVWYVHDRNPVRDVKRPKKNKRTRYVTNEEFQAVYALMPPRLQIAMDLAYLTGQRQGDLLSLTWDQVGEDGILFQPAKGRKQGKKFMMAYSDDLRAVLTRAKRMLPHLPRRYVLRTEEGERYTSEGFRSMWQRYMKKAVNGWVRRYKGRESVKHEPVIKERFTFHDLRAKHISDSTDIQKAMIRAQHSSMNMTRSVYDRGIRVVEPLK